MIRANPIRSQQTRQRIFDVALKLFADRGYAGTSVHDIAEAAHVAKPALYYHFGSKSGLFRALVEQTEDDVFHVISTAAAPVCPLPERLIRVCLAVFQVATRHGEVVRLALGQSLLARGATPAGRLCLARARRRLGVVRTLIMQGLADGTFRRELGDEQLTLGFVGLLQSHVLVRLVNPRHPLTRRTAEDSVHLFLRGAGPPVR